LIIEHGWPWCYLHRTKFEHHPVPYYSPDGIKHFAPPGTYVLDPRHHLPMWSTGRFAGV
jgi:hypothetical protein